MQMLTLNELVNEKDLDILFAQIRERRDFIKIAVGNLYPDIMNDEIKTIEGWITELRKHEPKQVIVMRKDLNMRKGKMIAQGAHASMGVLLYMMNQEEHFHFDNVTPITTYTLQADGYVREWLKKKFTKIAVYVNSEAELLEVYEKAKFEGLPACLITDSGLTEFGGVPTNTCCGIGPWRRDEIDAITGHLPLL